MLFTIEFSRFIRPGCESFPLAGFAIPVNISSVFGKVFTRLLEFLKGFIVTIVHHCFLEKLPVVWMRLSIVNGTTEKPNIFL